MAQPSVTLFAVIDTNQSTSHKLRTSYFGDLRPVGFAGQPLISGAFEPESENGICQTNGGEGAAFDHSATVAIRLLMV